MPTFKSPAKLNLFLKVLKKREDGYHDISSLFQAIDLYDEIEVHLTKKDILTCSNPSIPSDQHNLAAKALNLFRQKTGVNDPVNIHIEKNIPTEAGLGGGSSNAATTLWALNTLFKTKISTEQLMLWSAEIGSDVPFFFSQGTAYCTGKGEQVLSLDPLKWEEKVWIVKPPFGISTSSVYKNFDIRKIDPKTHENDFYNDLEISALDISPQLQKVKKDLDDQGFDDVVLCGSGSSFFGIGDEAPAFSKDFKIFHVNFINRQNNSWY